MQLEHMIAFVVFSVVTSVTPGPNNMMLAATGANVGMRRGLPHAFGISIGFGLMLFLTTVGIGAALTANAWLMLTLKVVGVGVLLWLAWKIATSTRAKADAGAKPIGFLGAAAFQWVNPKAWMICAGAVSFLEVGAMPAIVQAGIFALIFVVFGLPCMLVWLGFGAAMQTVLKTDRTLRIFNVTMGVLLAATVPLLL